MDKIKLLLGLSSLLMVACIPSMSVFPVAAQSSPTLNITIDHVASNLPVGTVVVSLVGTGYLPHHNYGDCLSTVGTVGSALTSCVGYPSVFQATSSGSIPVGTILTIQLPYPTTTLRYYIVVYGHTSVIVSATFFGQGI